jgi:SHS2 domain-containing protein
MKDFEIIPHTADLQIHVYGTTLPELFEHALQGMFQATKPQAQGCHYKDDRLICDTLPIMRDVGINSPDVNALLVDFLSTALYLSDVHNEIYLRMTVTSFTPNSIIADLHGVAISGMQESEIKAVTYHDLAIVQKDGIWQTDIVFDV